MFWITIGLVATGFLNGFLSPNNPFSLVNFVLLIALFACLVLAMIYRYRRGATLLERQQIKWLAFGGALDFILNWIGPILLPWLFPQTFAPHSLPNVLYQLVWPLTVLLIPISIAIAILRYRLWDIDTIINLTLVYGLLSGILGGLYLGLVIGLESLVGLLTGHSAIPPVIVVSTLAIAALFAPLRQRIQHSIDRRFYRGKYDAARTLEEFSETLRNEVDLATLREHLVVVVNETMRPAHISLWLSTPESRSVSPENENT
jgi:hypothetical protein